MKTKRKRKIAYFFFVLPIIVAAFFVFNYKCFATNSTIIINEIQTAGVSANDEFIELYNPTDNPVNLSTWSIQYRGGSGAAYYKKNFENNTIIPAKHFFLIAHGGTGNYAGATAFDMSWSQSFSSVGGTIFLANSQTLLTDETASSVVDRVAYGTGVYLMPENTPSIKPESSQSIGRKNFQDTDNNSVDFNLLNTPTPQNNSSTDNGSDDENNNQENTVPICKDKIILSEIFPFPGEFVEVENTGSEACDLAGWKIGDEKNSPHAFPADSLIDPGKYAAFVREFDLNSSSPDSARLFDPINIEPIEIRSYEKPESNHSYSKGESGTWKWTSIVTSGKKNEFDAPQTYSDKIQITELLPNSSDGDEEYIELFNNSDEKINLDGWSLHDASQSGEYIFSSADSIEAKKYFVIYKSDFKFALNDSGDESVTLFDPNKKEVFEVSYNGSKKGISYNFNGEDWHWSEFLTPGEENKFEKIPKGQLKIDEDVYVNVYADFAIGGLSKKAKVVWNFGDEHKSYIQKTRHKYVKIGKYDANVKYSEGSEDVVKNFTINVEKIPHPEVRIISVNANPKGSDTNNETITLQNNSKKKINLNDWSIATGWKKLSNHPISGDFEIKAGKNKEITREFSKFTLNNKKAEVELRYPDGKVAYNLKYNKKKDSVAEGEIYVKAKGGWKWQNKNVESIRYNVSSINTQSTVINNQEAANSEQENTDNNTENIPDEEIVEQPKIERENKLTMNNNKNIFKIDLSGSSPRVLGAETVRETDGTYFFTPEYSQEEHFTVIFLKNIFILINLKINTLMNYFFS